MPSLKLTHKRRKTALTSSFIKRPVVSRILEVELTLGKGVDEGKKGQSGTEGSDWPVYSRGQYAIS